MWECKIADFVIQYLIMETFAFELMLYTCTTRGQQRQSNDIHDL